LARAHRLLPLLLLSLGCNKLFAKDAPAPTAPDEAAKVDAPHAEEAPVAEKEKDGAARPARYGVPFAWETSPEEPLAKARTFMSEVLKANENFMHQGKDHFLPFANEEKPRATVLTCSDSRVQVGAWDGSPENDDYTVRNLGNQLSTSLGSVEYGVGRLHTPVLLIIGHTGCDAVKSVLDKSAAKGKGPIVDELSHLELPERFRRVRQDEEWDSLTKAVVANVDAQVADAVEHFAPFVQSGELTVVGAVYDFQNDFEDGHGRLRLVNVNSNVEASRIEAFQEAVKEDDKPAPTAFGQRRPTTNLVMPTVDRTGRPLPGGPRATINAVNILGSGNFDAVSTGTLRQPPLRPGSPVPGTSDLKVAPGYRPPFPRLTAEPDGHEPTAPADHGAPAGDAKPAPDGHEPPTPADHGTPAPAPGGHAPAPSKGRAKSAPAPSRNESKAPPAAKAPTEPTARGYAERAKAHAAPSAPAAHEEKAAPH
jgi:carbonic anhydrase